MAMKPSLDIVIVNWNAGLLLSDCLRSIANARSAELTVERVVVVDNASSDSSAENLSEFSVPVEVIRNVQNRGFAAACNQGASQSTADYLLFLNPDTELLSSSLTKPLEFMERAESASVGICGVQLLNGAGAVARTCSRFPTPMRLLSMMLGLQHLLPGLLPRLLMVEWDHSTTRAVDQVMGAFFLVRRQLFEELLGFDERFFVYYEEVDFSLRARQAGWKSFYLATAQVYHEGAGTTRNARDLTRFFYLRSRILFAYKHFSRIAAILVLFGTLSIEPISRAILALGKRSPKEALGTLAAHYRIWKSLPDIIALL